MKIFGKIFLTKKDYKTMVETLTAEREAHKEVFPFAMGQIVYDVALKNEQGRYTKINPSSEHSTITEVVVNEKNYFSLVKRYKNKDVFFTYSAAEDHLKTICK